MYPEYFPKFCQKKLRLIIDIPSKIEFIDEVNKIEKLKNIEKIKLSIYFCYDYPSKNIDETIENLEKILEKGVQVRFEITCSPNQTIKCIKTVKKLNFYIKSCIRLDLSKIDISKIHDFEFLNTIYTHIQDKQEFIKKCLNLFKFDFLIFLGFEKCENLITDEIIISIIELDNLDFFRLIMKNDQNTLHCVTHFLQSIKYSSINIFKYLIESHEKHIDERINFASLILNFDYEHKYCYITTEFDRGMKFFCGKGNTKEIVEILYSKGMKISFLDRKIITKIMFNDIYSLEFIGYLRSIL